MTAEPLAAWRDLLAPVLDTLVPPSGEFPAAGSIALDHVQAVAANSPAVASLLARALDAIEAAAAGGAARFAELDADAREAVLRRVERSDAAAFDALVRHTYDGYYSHPAIVARLGLDPRPPHPGGHRVEVGDLGALARVVARGPIYRRPV